MNALAAGSVLPQEGGADLTNSPAAVVIKLAISEGLFLK